MSDFEQMTPQDRKILHLEGMLVLHSARVKALEEILALLAHKLNPGLPGTKDLLLRLPELQQAKLKDLLAHLADGDPQRAAQLALVTGLKGGQ